MQTRKKNNNKQHSLFSIEFNWLFLFCFLRTRTKTSFFRVHLWLFCSVGPRSAEWVFFCLSLFCFRVSFLRVRVCVSECSSLCLNVWEYVREASTRTRTHTCKAMLHHAVTHTHPFLSTHSFANRAFLFALFGTGCTSFSPYWVQFGLKKKICMRTLNLIEIWDWK